MSRDITVAATLSLYKSPTTAIATTMPAAAPTRHPRSATWMAGASTCAHDAPPNISCARSIAATAESEHLRDLVTRAPGQALARLHTTMLATFIAELIDSKAGLAARALDGSDEVASSTDVQLEALVALLTDALSQA